MSELEKFQRVNKAETILELQQCILDFAVNGQIQGRTRLFDAQKMSNNLKLYFSNNAPPEVITREFGLRQQAMYLKYYGQ